MPRSAGIFIIVAGLLLFVCVQVPFWILRVVTQQEIDVPSESGGANSAEPHAQFGMRHLLIGMAVVGMLLALVKFSLPPGTLSGPPVWFGIIAGGLTFIVFSAAICLPCVLLTLGDRKRGLWATVLLLVVVCGPLVVFALLAAIGNVDFYEIADVLIDTFAFGLGAAATQIVVLLIARAVGYRLILPLVLKNIRDTSAGN